MSYKCVEPYLHTYEGATHRGTESDIAFCISREKEKMYKREFRKQKHAEKRCVCTVEAER